MRLLLLLWSSLTFAAPITPLVTGNGFGFAVVPLQTNALTKFYVHPYKFTAMDPTDPYGAGFETTNLLTQMGWQGEEALTSIAYQEESQIIATETTSSKYFYFMPFTLKHPAVVLVRQGDGDPCLNVQWAHPVAQTQVMNGAIQFKFKDIADSALLIPFDRKASLDSSCLKGSNGWMLMAVDDSPAALIGAARQWMTDDVVARELNALETWRVPQPADFSFDELHLWRQSETILRMAQSQEPNRPGRYNHGLIVASLPEGGWFMPWVRDMSYAALGLIRMGHQQEARWALEAYFNARPIGRVKNMVRDFPYQISVVRYFGDGTEETDFGGENAPNVEFDNWGNVLTILGEYIERFQDWNFLTTQGVRGSVLESARDFIVKPLLGNTDPAGDGLILTKDTSIWEANAGSEQHFSYSTAAAIQGLTKFAMLESHAGYPTASENLLAAVAKLKVGFKAAFIPDGFIHGTMEDNSVYNYDSAVLEPINFAVVTDSDVIRKTLDIMEQLKMPSGGYRRIRGDRQYDKQEFVFSDFNWARVHLRLGDGEVATPLMKTVVERSVDDNGFIPEMYVSEVNDEYPGAIGAPTGSIPMVGYGAGMAIIYLQERAWLHAPH